MVNERDIGSIHRIEVTCSTAGMAHEIHRLLEANGYEVTSESCELADAYCRVVGEHAEGGPGFLARRRLVQELKEMVGKSY